LGIVKAVEKEEISAVDAAAFVIGAKGAAWGAANVVRCCCNELAGLDAMCVDGLLTDEECDALVATAEGSGLFSFWSREDAKEGTPEGGSEEGRSLRAFRNADTIEMTHSSIAQELWARLEPLLDPSVAALDVSAEGTPQRWERDIEGTWVSAGTNDNLLLSRYLSGGHFSPHTDGYSVVDLNHRSMYSLILYLNDCHAPGPSDGGTRFYDDSAKGKLALEEEKGPGHDGAGKDKRTAAPRWSSDRALERCCVAAVKGRCLIFYHNHVHEGTPPAQGHAKYIIRSDLMFRRTPPICDSAADGEAYRLYREAVDLAGVAGREKDALPLFQRAFRMSPALADLYGM
jgi:leukotriene-A4 hydrolase